jgi:hypothetical protein
MTWSAPRDDTSPEHPKSAHTHAVAHQRLKAGLFAAISWQWEKTLDAREERNAAMPLTLIGNR